MRRWTQEELRKRLYDLIDQEQPIGIEDPLGLWAAANKQTRREAKQWVEQMLPTILTRLNEAKAGKDLKQVSEFVTHRLKNVMFKRD